MKGIGGNFNARIQVYTTTKNEIGEKEKIWDDVQTVRGWLDLSDGDSRYTTFYAKIQESTHIFIADYVDLDPKITAENSRMYINGFYYDVLLIDNPMELRRGSQWEFYLRFTGRQ